MIQKSTILPFLLNNHKIYIYSFMTLIKISIIQLIKYFKDFININIKK
jgi:hypothetical protein